eukprot:3701133-Pyramimonas_sp.AAC.1
MSRLPSRLSRWLYISLNPIGDFVDCVCATRPCTAWRVAGRAHKGQCTAAKVQRYVKAEAQGGDFQARQSARCKDIVSTDGRQRVQLRRAGAPNASQWQSVLSFVNRYEAND